MKFDNCKAYSRLPYPIPTAYALTPFAYSQQLPSPVLTGERNCEEFEDRPVFPSPIADFTSFQKGRKKRTTLVRSCGAYMDEELNFLKKIHQLVEASAQGRGQAAS